MYGYKLFEKDKNEDYHALFINWREIVPIGKWIHAEYHPTKSFAPRGGWHLGADVPDAPWLKAYSGTETGYYKSRWKTGKRVWCKVEYNANTDYNKEVSKLPEKCFTDKVPDNGFYFFREAGKGVWIISSDIFIVKEITEEERQEIMKCKGYDEAAAFAKYKVSFEKRMKIAA